MFPVTMIRLLKGAPLACLVALACARRDGLGPQGGEWLERATGYSDKPVSQALLFLEEQGLISRNGRYLWQMRGELVQLPLGVDLEAPGNLGLAPRGLGLVNPQSAADSLGLGDIPTSVSSGSRGFIDSKVKESSSSEAEKLRLNEKVIEACNQAGIRDPARKALAQLGHVTPELVEYHARTAGNLGLAIFRIKNDWPIRVEPGARSRKDYIGGEFAEFIKS
jgi:hypothetical protein